MRVKITVNEIVEFNHEIITDIPGITEDEIDNMLNNVEKKAHGLDDVTLLLEEQGCRIHECIEDESGDLPKIEITDYNELD